MQSLISLSLKYLKLTNVVQSITSAVFTNYVGWFCRSSKPHIQKLFFLLESTVFWSIKAIFGSGRSWRTDWQKSEWMLFFLSLLTYLLTHVFCTGVVAAAAEGAGYESSGWREHGLSIISWSELQWCKQLPRRLRRWQYSSLQQEEEGRLFTAFNTLVVLGLSWWVFIGFHWF